MNAKTIKRPFVLSGLGLHSGKAAEASLSPAPTFSGIIFHRLGQAFPAHLDQLTKTERGTTLGGIGVVEHLLSALYALGISNLEIKVKGDEIPIIDGSALPFIEALEQAEIIEQEEPLFPFEIKKPLLISAGEAALEALPYHGLKIDFMVEFQGIGRQELSFDLYNQSYAKEIAPARTFGFLEEYESLKQRGLGLGVTAENVVVLSKRGPLTRLRMKDEPVRHKILDLIGDLSLLGRPLFAHIRAQKSGHKLNAELVRRIIGDA